MTEAGKIAAICLFLSWISYGHSENILGLMGCASHSHHLWNEVIFNALVQRGHTLTIVSPDTTKSPHDNVSYIHLEATYKSIEEHYKDESTWITSGLFSNVRMLYDYQMVTCKGILQSKGFQEALKLDEKFDLILYDIATGPCLLRLIEKYPDVPVVGVSAFKMAPEILNIVGGHNYPGYVPLFTNQLDIPMNLWNRLYNAASYTVSHYYRKYVSDSIIDTMVGRHIPGVKTPLDDLYKRLEVILVNTHPAIDHAKSLPPSIIEIGGLHIKEPQALPTDIKEFIEKAEKGAVLISLGTNIKAETLGEKRLEMFVKVIQRLSKFNFLWKVENEGLVKTVPKNLLIRKWFPQNDILAHPNLKAFFTHAGGLSIQEATWFGVPVVAMPFFIDQITNAQHVRVKGCGRVVDFQKLTEQSLFQGLSGVLTDDVYRSNMLQIQKQFRSRQNQPLDTAIWWIEYVLKNPQVDYLISSSRDLSYFVANSLDVIFIFVSICLAFFVNTWIVIKNIRVSLSKSKDKQKKESKSGSKSEGKSESKSLSKKKVKRN